MTTYKSNQIQVRGNDTVTIPYEGTESSQVMVPIFTIYINRKKKAELYDIRDVAYFLERYENDNAYEEYRVEIQKDIMMKTAGVYDYD